VYETQVAGLLPKTLILYVTRMPFIGMQHSRLREMLARFHSLCACFPMAPPLCMATAASSSRGPGMSLAHSYYGLAV
jgi:hypothetical protein